MSVKICSIGDIMLGENVHHYGRSITSRFKENYQSMIPTSLFDTANQADISVGNLECSLMPDHERQNASIARAIYAASESALTCFDNWKRPVVFNLANNHFGQHGKAAMDYTLKCLKERGIHSIGTERSPLELSVNGASICFWGVTIVKDKYGNDGYLKSSVENLLNDLNWGSKPHGTFWVISIHWGEEYLTLPSAVQEKLAKNLADRGVDLILGHHPHVIQPVRYVKGIPVAYSHGNFVFDQNFSKLTQLGLMMLTELDDSTFLLYKLKCHNFRILSSSLISAGELETFCAKNMSNWNPLIMRFLMKLELLFRAYEVPKEVWTHFLSKWIKKISRN